MLMAENFVKLVVLLGAIWLMKLSYRPLDQIKTEDQH